MKKTYTCPHCGQHFEFESLKNVGGFMSAHIRTCEKNPKREYYIRQLKEFRTLGSKCQAIKRHNEVEASKKEYSFTCENPKCCKEYTKILTDAEYKHYKDHKHFCSRACANTRFHNEETKKKISKALKAKPIEKICSKCGRKFFGLKNGRNKCSLCNSSQKHGRLIDDNGQILKIESCSLRKTTCPDCGKEIYAKTTAPLYCEECAELHDCHKYQVYDANGHRVFSKARIEKAAAKVRENVKNGKHVGWKTRPIASYPEQFWKKVLENNEIEYEFNFPVAKSSLGLEYESAAYFLDFKLKNKIDLEIDGKQHKYPERILKDKERDNLLTANGWIVYRIEWNEITSEEGSKLMKEKIDAFLKWYNTIVSN